MEVEVVPKPDPEEREALLAALSGSLELDKPPAYRSPWRRAALEPEDDQD